ncbi:hypothetical protein WG906_17325 [Pedobacter sp. P351]|uniref:hypothetical protein n=1 Tax=Pedobacter superstes TaxID=3133441 RepID=UPI003099BD74
MIKKLILTYYYVWFQGHLRSKYADDFSHHWCHAFLQVLLTFFCLLIASLNIINASFDLNIIATTGRRSLVGLVLIIPGFILYHLLFNIYEADKKDDDPAKFKIVITKGSKVISWLIFIVSRLLAMGSIYIVRMLK